jgi:protein SDA1
LESYGILSPDTRKSLIQNLVMLRNKEVISSIEWVPQYDCKPLSDFFSLLKSLFPLLPRSSSPTLRSYIRKTILSDIKVANTRSQNHKLNRAVQAMLFSMVERGMSGEVTGDKGKLRAAAMATIDPDAHNTDEAMWAVILTKELWRKQVW